MQGGRDYKQPGGAWGLTEFSAPWLSSGGSWNLTKCLQSKKQGKPHFQKHRKTPDTLIPWTEINVM